MATISISQLDTATQASVDDLYEVAVVDENSQTGYASRKVTAAQIATLISQGIQFSGLSTEAKTIIEAINEAAQNGGSEVEPNPVEDPTDTLETIGIDGTVYEVGGSAPVSKTATGNPIHIEDAADAPIVSGEVTFEPKQDLHGYDKPWAGGAGKNKCPLVLADIKAANIDGTWNGDTYVLSGMSYSVLTNNGGNITGINIDGTTASYPSLVLYNGTLPLGNYILTLSDNNNVRYRIFKNGDTLKDSSNPFSFAVDNAEDVYLIIIFTGSVSISNVLAKPMIRLATETDATFEPYSNICPIEGYTDCEVEVTDDATSPTVTNTYTIDLDGTRYGGKIYPVTGKMSVGMGRIASYNGESIGEPWLSDRDEYVAGTTPTIGAEVVYTLATPLSVQLTPEQIRTLEGTNNISTNMTNMSLEYITQDYQSLVKLIEQSAGHHYSEQERVVGTYFGKPLYERSYSVTTPDAINTVHQIIEVPANSKIVNIFGMYDNQFPLNFYFDVDNRINTWLNNAKTHVVNRTPYNLMLNLPGIVTIQYTKTTD